MFSVWFACETCRESFLKLDDFLQHKIQLHLEEFQNTKYIVFEERRIQSTTDLDKIKIENENKFDPSNPQLTCDTIQNVGFVKTENQSIDQDCVDGVDKFISSTNVTTIHSDFDLKPAVNTTYISQNYPTVNDSYSAEDKFANLRPDLDIENGNNAAPKVNANELNSDFGQTQIFIESQQNPFVLLRRLTSQEIKKYSASENASSSAQFQCKLCLHEFKSDLELNTHVKACALSHRHRLRFCALCNRKFYRRRCLLRHVSRRHASGEGIQKVRNIKNCSQCTKTFRFECELKRHVVTHSSNNARPFKCKIPNCTKTFKLAYCLRKHTMHVHTESRPFKCPHVNCGKIFKLNVVLRNHLLTHSNQEPFKCPNPSCPKTFKSRDTIRIHMKLHSNLRSFKCPIADCERAFNLKSDLKNHLVSHSDERPFKCLRPNCNRTYKHKRDYCKHMRVAHTGPFSCPETNCGRRFKDDNSLQQHQILHSDPKPFKCTQIDCGKEFKTITCLKTHRAVHSDPSPFQCPQIDCGKRFETKIRLYTHQIVHFKVKPFQCFYQNCGKRFKVGIKLNRHLQLVSHNDSP